jgi:hypothetical protein
MAADSDQDENRLYATSYLREYAETNDFFF